MKPLRIFIGYDTREPVAYHVLAHSILRRASGPVTIAPLALNVLAGSYERPVDPKASTQFSYTRFLVPWLSGYEGLSVYMDCDMLCLADIHEILCTLILEPVATAVWVAQHEYVPKADVKFLGNSQIAYPRKNWSSLMVFDNARCRALWPPYVNAASGLELHRFWWLKDEEIGALPLEWNWLVGEYPKNPDAKILHYTNGGPWFDGYRACDHAEEWFREREDMLRPFGAHRTPRTPSRWPWPPGVESA